MAEMKDPQLLDVLQNAADFLYEHGVSDGAVACHDAADLLPKGAHALGTALYPRERHEVEKASLLAEARARGLL
jgi:hypothetical protein